MEPDWIERRTVEGGHDLDYNFLQVAVGSVRTARGRRFAVKVGPSVVIFVRGRDQEFSAAAAEVISELSEELGS